MWIEQLLSNEVTQSHECWNCLLWQGLWEHQQEASNKEICSDVDYAVGYYDCLYYPMQCSVLLLCFPSQWQGSRHLWCWELRTVKDSWEHMLSKPNPDVWDQTYNVWDQTYASHHVVKTKFRMYKTIGWYVSMRCSVSSVLAEWWYNGEWRWAKNYGC